MADSDTDLFREVIIEHSQFPRHHRELQNPTHDGTAENPMCGDRVRLQLRVSDDGVLEDIAFQAVGCAMSTASASMLVSHLKGKKLEEAEALFTAVHGLFSDEDPARDSIPEDLAALGVAKRYPARVKCVTMPWHHVKALLDSADGNVSTVF